MGNWFGLRPMIDNLLWKADKAAMNPWQAWGLGALRVAYVVGRDLFDGDLNQRAMSLVYTTLLSLVPLLAISFSVLKGFGVHNQIEPILLGVLEPLGEQGVVVTGRVLEYVENINVGVLGSLGLGVLVFTVLSLMHKIERAFNHIWYVSRQRSFARRFSDFLSVIVIGPLLIFASSSLTAAASNQSAVKWLADVPVIGVVVGWGGTLFPYLLVVCAFAFIYMFMPNTRVQVRSAFVGAVVTAFLWKGMGWLFATFVASSAQYEAVYSVFATLVLFMIWLYLGWLILLIGSSIAFYDQNPEYLKIRRNYFRMSNRLSERLSLHVAYRIASNYQRGETCWTAGALAQVLNVPTLAVERILDEFERRSLVTRTSDEPPAYLPARPIDQITITDILNSTRERGEKDEISVDVLPEETAVDHAVDMMERAVDKSVHGMTLKDLAVAGLSPPLQAVAGTAASDAETGKNRLR